MLVVLKKGFEKELNDIFVKWELDCTEVGRVTKDKMLTVVESGKVVASIPSEELVLGGGAPQYDMPYKEPEYIKEINNLNCLLYTSPSPRDRG